VVNTFKVWPPPKPRLISPEDGARLSLTRPTFVWEDARHYGQHRDRIQVSAETSFRILLFEDELTVNEVGRWVLPVELEYGQTYYWRVRFEDICDECIWFNPEEMGMPGRWSEIRRFDVFLGMPPKVFLEHPASGIRVSSPVTLTWNPVLTATSYMVLLSDEEDCSRVVKRLFPSDNSVSVPFREPDGRYYWKVRATNEAGYGEWSDTWNFHKTSELPNQVMLREPENGAVLHSATPLWRWEDSGYQGNAFHIQVSNVSHFATATINEDNLSGEIDQFHSPVNLRSHTTYYWRVRKRDRIGWGPWSEVRNFRVDLSTTSAARVTLTSPDEGETLDKTLVYFNWHSDPSYCAGYQFQLAHDRGFGELLSDQYSTGRTTRVHVPEAGETYYWRVRAQDDVGWGGWSGIRSFKTKSVGWNPELYNPKGLIDRTKPEFSWEGSSLPTVIYRLQVSTDPDFRFLVLDKADIAEASYIPRKDLPVGPRYYWRVLCKKNTEQRWSSTDKFETFWIQITPVPVMIVSPEDGAILRTTIPRFSWRSGPRSFNTETELVVSDHRDFSTTVFQASTTGNSLVSPRNLSDGTYCWRVRQRLVDITGWDAWSEAGCFTVDITPPEIDVTAPRTFEISTSTIPARVVVSCEVSDNLTGVKKVEYYLSRRKVASRTTPHHGSTYIADITGLCEGKNTIAIQAYDNSGPEGNFSTASFELEIKRILGIEKKEPVIPKEHRLPTSPVQKTLQDEIKKDMQIKMHEK